MRRVVVTGLGLVTPLGADVETTWKNLIAGKSGAGTITHFDASDQKCTIACEVKGPDHEYGFDPGKRVELSMGYRGAMRTMLKGEITSLRPSFPAGGGSTLTVSGLNILHSFRTEQASRTYVGMTDSQIAEQIGQRLFVHDGGHVLDAHRLQCTVQIRCRIAGTAARDDAVAEHLPGILA